MRANRLLIILIAANLLMIVVAFWPAGRVDCADTQATGIPEHECVALLALYDATDGDNWRNHTRQSGLSFGDWLDRLFTGVRDNRYAPDSRWLVGDSPCGWYGVTCDVGHVIRLDLARNHLQGHIPAEVGDLTQLVQLNLGYNQLTGEIPPSFILLTNLRNFSVCAGNHLNIGDIDVENFVSRHSGGPAHGC